MTTTIPRDELNAAGRRHGINYGYEADPSAEEVRRLAADVRSQAPYSSAPSELHAEADDLDALADRYEREAS